MYLRYHLFFLLNIILFLLRATTALNLPPTLSQPSFWVGELPPTQNFTTNITLASNPSSRSRRPASPPRTLEIRVSFIGQRPTSNRIHNIIEELERRHENILIVDPWRPYYGFYFTTHQFSIKFVPLIDSHARGGIKVGEAERAIERLIEILTREGQIRIMQFRINIWGLEVAMGEVKIFAGT